MRGHSRTVTVDAEVWLDEFDDDIVLEEAVEIVQNHKSEVEPPSDDYRHKQWTKKNELCSRLAALLGVDQEEGLAPPSTAARIRSIDELRKAVAESPLFKS